MKISWNYLKNLVDLNNITVAEVEDKLTLAGFEIENKTEIKEIKDIILEINITPNRKDVIGFINIATELSALFKRTIIINDNLQKSYNKIRIKKINNSTQLNSFSTFFSCIIENTKVNIIETSITNDLRAFGIKVTNSILDIINLINLKWGQEIKLYKLPKCNKNKIDQEICQLQYNINNQTGNTIELKLNNQILIQINEKNFEEYQDTSKIILVNYEYSNIVEKNKYNNHDYCIYAYTEIFNIFTNISNNIQVPNTIYQYRINSNNKKEKTIICSIDKINQVLGPIQTIDQSKFLNIEIITNTLKDLNFKIEEGPRTIQVKVPDNRRNDISEDIDIIEEIGRIHGFNNFNDNLPIFYKKNRKAKRASLNQKIRRILRSIGLHEVINYAIKTENKNSELQIVNPLNKDQQTLRQNLIYNLILSKQYNTNQANEPFEVFEIGNVFQYDSLENKYTESLHLSCIFGNHQFNQSTWKENKSSLTWSQTKGQIEELFEKVEAKTSWSTNINQNGFIKSFEKYIHHQNKIYIKNKNKTIGIFSQLDKNINESICKSYNIYFFEINLDELATTITRNSQLDHIYLAYSNYPKIARDFSIKIDVNTSMKEIQPIILNIKNQNSNIIESIVLKNEYYNTNTIKTICLRITYRSQNKTLTNKEAEILDKMFKSKLYQEIMSKT